jgi:hypothetical protein
MGRETTRSSRVVAKPIIFFGGTPMMGFGKARKESTRFSSTYFFSVPRSMAAVVTAE